MKLKKAKYYLIPILLCIVGAAVLGYWFFFTPFARSDSKQYIFIDRDDTADSVFAKLKPAANDCPLTALSTLARHYGYTNNIKTGRYAVEPGYNAIDMFRILYNGRQVPMMLTVPECRTMEQLAGRLSHKLMLDSAEIADALTDNDFCTALGYDTCTIACVFVPNTYEVYWNTSIEKLMQRMVAEHDTFWNEERKKKAAFLQLTPNEVATLASIVDEETNNNAEKPIIAGMYINRLHLGMPLQACPTVKFALKDFTLRRIYQKHLDTESPYNTYINIGLPPGPIKIASIKGIDAVLNREIHHYLYMCAKDDFSGTHHFSTSYSEHQKYAASYARELSKKGIK